LIHWFYRRDRDEPEDGGGGDLLAGRREDEDRDGDP